MKNKNPYDYQQNIQTSIPYSQTKKLIRGNSAMKPFTFNATPLTNLQKKQTFVNHLKKKEKQSSAQEMIKLNIHKLEKTLPFLLHYK